MSNILYIMFTYHSSRLQTIPFLSSTKHVFKMSYSKNSYPLFSTCCYFYHSSPQLSEDAISYFKNRKLAQFVNNLVSGKVSSSFPHFNYSPSKETNLLSLIEQFNASKDNLTSLKDLQKDAKDDVEFCKTVQEELMSLEKCLNEVEEAILNELLSDEDESISDVIMEVSAGVGGQEAMLFAQELNSLYYNYLNFCGWQFELATLEETDLGGVRHSMILISGKNSFKLLSIEGGVHRVQRVPATERGSRMHTSTATVTVYPQPSEVDIVIPESDVKIETKTSSGPGGQHANKIQTAVRLYHLPSGIAVECQTTRSQTKNREIAMQKLRSKLFQIECEKRDSKVASARKFQMGLRGRNEKIRTYNFVQDRITDHRFHVSCNNLEKYFEGNSYYHNFLKQLHEAQNQKRKEEFLQAVGVAK